MTELAPSPPDRLPLWQRFGDSLFDLAGLCLLWGTIILLPDGLMVLEIPAWLAVLVAAAFLLWIGFALVWVDEYRRAARGRPPSRRSRLTYVVLAGLGMGVLLLLPRMGGIMAAIDDLSPAEAPFTITGDRITLSGPFTRSTGRQFARSLDSLARTLGSSPAKPTPVTLLLDSPGGNVFGAGATIDAIRSHPEFVFTAEIPADGVCASACGFVFLSVERRIVHRSSTLMLHGADAYEAVEFGASNRQGARLMWGVTRLYYALPGALYQPFRHANPTVAAVLERLRLFDHHWYEFSPCLYVNGADLGLQAPRIGLPLTLMADPGEGSAPPDPPTMSEACRQAPRIAVIPKGIAPL